MTRTTCLWFAWRRAIRRSTLQPNTRLVAMMLAEHMDADGGSCYPSVALLVDETGLSRPTVKRGRAKLIKLGWLAPDGYQVVKTSGGQQSVPRFRAVFPEQGGQAMSPPDAARGDQGEPPQGGQRGAHRFPKGGSQVSKGGLTGYPQGRHKGDNEGSKRLTPPGPEAPAVPSPNGRGERAPVVAELELTPPGGRPATPAQQLVNRVIEVGLKGRRPTEYDKQARRAAQLLRRHTLQDLLVVVEALPAQFPYSGGETFDVFDVGRRADKVLAKLQASGDDAPAETYLGWTDVTTEPAQ